MVKSILPRNSSKLNLTPKQTDIFRKIIYIGNQMANLLAELEHRGIQPKAAKKLSEQWGKAMVKLVKMLLD